MEEHSGVKFNEAQVALAREWVGVGGQGQTEVTVALPSTSGTGLVQSEKGKDEKTTETVKIPDTTEEAQDIIHRWERASEAIPEDDNVSDNVVQHMLQDETSLASEDWAGSEEEERAAYVSELLYIHSKLMIVDDRRVIVRFIFSFWCIFLTLVCRWALLTLTTAHRRATATLRLLWLSKTLT